MSDSIKVYKGVLLNRVVHRYRVAMEFPSEEALAEYLKDHPKADKSKHKVNPDKKPSRKEKSLQSERGYQDSDDYKKSLKKDYYPQKAPKGMEYPKAIVSKIPAGIREHVDSMTEEDLDKEKSYQHPALKKFVTTIVERLKDGKRGEVEDELRKIEDLRDEVVNKSHAAKSDAERDPYRFMGRKLYHAWQAYNEAFYQFNNK